jgi:hypothetical protein
MSGTGVIRPAPIGRIYVLNHGLDSHERILGHGKPTEVFHSHWGQQSSWNARSREYRYGRGHVCLARMTVLRGRIRRYMDRTLPLPWSALPSKVKLEG